MKVAFITGIFPNTTETFVMNQITDLVKSKVDLKIISLYTPINEKTSADVSKHDLLNITRYVGVPRNKLVRAVKGLAIFIKNLFLNPIKIIKSVNFFRYGKVAWTLHPLYLADYFLKNKIEYDILHCHFGQRGIYGALLKEIGIPGKLVTSFYGGDVTAFVEKTNKKIYDALFENGDLFLPLCDDFKKRLIELGAPENKTITQHIGIDMDNFNLFKKDAKKIVQILDISRFVEKKGHIYLIRALSEVIKKNKNFNCTFVGGGDLREECKNIASSLGLQSFVKFVDTVNPDDLPILYKNSDIFVLPSITSKNGDTEGTPSVIIEAQASGLPVVSTYHAGIPEIVVDKKSGFLVNEKDVTSLANCILELIEDSNLRKKMGEFGRKHALEEFDRNKQVKKLIRLYESVLTN